MNDKKAKKDVMQKSVSPTVSGKVTARYGKGEKTLEKMRNAAIEELYTRGFHKTSVCEIVSRAGLTRGAFYNYWNTLDECVIDVIHHINELSGEDRILTNLYKKANHPSSTVRFTQALMTRVIKKKWKEGHLILSLIHEKDLEGEDLRRTITEFMESSMKKWISIVASDQKQGMIQKDLDPESVAGMITTIMGAVFHHEEARYSGMRKTQEKTLQMCLNHILAPSVRKSHQVKSVFI